MVTIASESVPGPGRRSSLTSTLTRKGFSNFATAPNTRRHVSLYFRSPCAFSPVRTNHCSALPSREFSSASATAVTSNELFDRSGNPSRMTYLIAASVPILPRTFVASMWIPGLSSLV